ncbi:hypothetical protein O181_042555 [Austropuccinia psidii MF-1]|uniref:Secreted protein n=1 Tax=Austropuccinia psidii MF-1 TaxID=1389203 RepID=A0A9Q3HIA9_9BASI|nr:hypothetical protein [Austropuccinia psidii MF-1]
MRLQHCPPSPPSPLVMLLHPLLIFSLAYNPYAASGPQVMPPTPPSPPLTPPHTHHLPSLRFYSARSTCLRCCLPSLCLQCPPDMPLTALTILTPI